MIGHQILLNSKDSTSRVLPIKKEGERYRIQFESEFDFKPETLVAIVDSVVQDTKFASSYIVEVEQCDSGEMVYSYKVNEEEQSDIIPCKSRVQPKNCYSLLFTLLPASNLEAVEENTTISEGKNSIFNWILWAILVGAVLFIVWWFFLRKSNRTSATNPNLIPLGEYHFDKRNAELLIEERRIELTGKEVDLLLLLYDAANTTVERELILNRVWGDDGDYVGRTLDVFISKLRKKLEFDSKVKIVNIRGVGYKLLINE
ncbi:MAG: response regulator transcription factor [Flavobacteriaceae bacterium]|nr:response regulator transcription factor [Flavobacteriaceae bacterium]